MGFRAVFGRYRRVSGSLKGDGLLGRIVSPTNFIGLCKKYKEIEHFIWLPEYIGVICPPVLDPVYRTLEF
jgi:hypothetical protein